MDNSPKDQADVIDIYRKRARSYDASGIAGLEAWRREVVHSLNLRRGDVVVDIGCGTGLNFALLQEAVGPEGKIIGVDLTDAMLEQARQRINDHGWKNVELVQSDAGQYEFPKQVDGVVSAFALTFIPDCARVIQHGSQALAPGRAWVVLDMAWPARLPIGARRILFFLSSYGITLDVVKRRQWELVHQAMRQYLVEVTLKHFWLGFFYLASGKRPQ